MPTDSTRVAEPARGSAPAASARARWGARELSWAVISLGAALLVSSLLAVGNPELAGLVLWVGLAAPVVWALLRHVPRRLLRFRAIDVLWGIGFGVALRVVQGWLDVALGESAGLPSYLVVGGGLPVGWWFTGLVSVLVIAPLVEEFFFRGLVQTSVRNILRARFGRGAAMIVGVIAGASSFALLHLATNPDGSAGQLLGVLALGLACGVLVATTGRIWGAVLLHVVFNATYVLLALAGTFL